MMLSPADLLLVGGTALGCTAIVMGAAFLVLRFARRASLGLRMGVVVAAAALAIAFSTLVVAGEMYISEHDLTVLVWVVGASALLSLVGAWLVARTVRATITRLGHSARRIGDGDVVAAASGGWKELDELAAELANSSERLAIARAEVDRLDASRRQLVAWVSHDLRTPLAGIRVMAEALEEGMVEDPLPYVRQIRVQVDSIGRMVDGLFELSKIHSGTLQLRKEPVVLLDLVSDAVADMRPLAGERGIRITQTGIGDLMLLADPGELTRVIANLLANSIRHAPENSEILVSADRTDGDRLVLSVLDHGPGVATQDLGRMFDVGWRGTSARTLDPTSLGSPGAGLGLAIVQGIVEAHGGHVTAEHVREGFRLNVVFPGAAREDSGS